MVLKIRNEGKTGLNWNLTYVCIIHKVLANIV